MYSVHVSEFIFTHVQKINIQSSDLTDRDWN